MDVVRAGLLEGLGAARLGGSAAGYARDEVMAIGDNLNDLQMLEFAGTPVVMGNALAELKTRGWAVTATNDEAGVARAIETFVLRRGVIDGSCIRHDGHEAWRLRGSPKSEGARRTAARRRRSSGRVADGPRHEPKKKIDRRRPGSEARALIWARRGRLALGLALMLVNRLVRARPAGDLEVPDRRRDRQGSARSC